MHSKVRLLRMPDGRSGVTYTHQAAWLFALAQSFEFSRAPDSYVPEGIDQNCPCKPSRHCSLFFAVALLVTWTYLGSKISCGRCTEKKPPCPRRHFCMSFVFISCALHATTVPSIQDVLHVILILRSYFESEHSYASDYTLSHHSATAPGNFQSQGLSRFCLGVYVCLFI